MALRQTMEPLNQEMAAYFSQPLPHIPCIYVNILPKIFSKQTKTYRLRWGIKPLGHIWASRLLVITVSGNGVSIRHQPTLMEQLSFIVTCLHYLSWNDTVCDILRQTSLGLHRGFLIDENHIDWRLGVWGDCVFLNPVVATIFTFPGITVSLTLSPLD